MLDVLLQHCAQVAWSGDEYAVGALGPGCAHEPFGERVHPRTLRRDLDNVDLDRGEHGVDASVNVASLSQIRCVNRYPVSSSCHVSSRASWVAQAAVGWSVIPSNVELFQNAEEATPIAEVLSCSPTSGEQRETSWLIVISRKSSYQSRHLGQRVGSVLPVLLPRMGLERASTASQVRVTEVLPIEHIDAGRALYEAPQRGPWDSTGNFIESEHREAKTDG